MFGTFFGIIGLICAVLVIYDVFTAQKKMTDLHKILWLLGDFGE